MIDAHCHIDLYQDPMAVISEAKSKRVTLVAVTNLPSHYVVGLPHVKGHSHIKFALGLHPLMASQHAIELPRFLQLAPNISFIGEIGLDFSREGVATADRQVESFHRVLTALGDRPRFLTLHSRKAEDKVIDLLEEHNINGAVFHWYTGNLTTLERAVQAGHYFSINPAMIVGKRWREMIAKIPQCRVLTETDGPYLQLNGESARPGDVSLVQEELASIWNVSLVEVERHIHRNFGNILHSIREGKKS